MRLLVLAGLVLLLSPVAAARGAPFDVEIAMNEKWAKPQTALVFPADLTNVHEKPIKVFFEVVAKDGEAIAVVPNPTTLQPGASAWIPFMVQTPYRNGHLDETTRVTYRAIAKDAGTLAPVGEPAQFDLIVHTKGFYVPGPQLFAAMLALGIAALVLRRRP